MSDLMNMYNYYADMAEQYKAAPAKEENTARYHQFTTLAAYVAREIERRSEE